MHGSQVLLAYVDTNPDPARPDFSCPVVPARFSSLIGSDLLGQFLILRFRLAEFVECANKAELLQTFASKNPAFTASKLGGFWCFPADFAKECMKSTNMKTWQDIVRTLSHFKDFGSEEYFMTLTGIFKARSEAPVAPKNGEFQLKANQEYAVKIFHFHPESDDHKMPLISTVLRVTAGSDDIKALTSPSLAIDSAYDLKAFFLRMPSPLTSDYTSITVSVENSSAATDAPGVAPEVGTKFAPKPELFLPVKIVPSSLRYLLSILVMSALLFCQQYIAATSKGEIPHRTTEYLGVLAILTAVLAVYTLKKPL